MLSTSTISQAVTDGIATGKDALGSILPALFAFAVLVGLFWLGYKYFKRLTGIRRK